MKVRVKRIARNIHLLSSGNYEVQVWVKGIGHKRRYFSSGTPLADMRAWVNETRRELKAQVGTLGTTRAERAARAAFDALDETQRALVRMWVRIVVDEIRAEGLEKPYTGADLGVKSPSDETGHARKH